MNVLIIGYGKMGKTIEKILIERGHNIVGAVNETDKDQFQGLLSEADVAIEFTHPESAYSNLSACIESGTPVVSGTTGWLDRYDDICDLTRSKEGAFFYASNFSVGVNIFFAINEKLAQMMSAYPHYTTEVHETHHTEKKDAPSGTAITIAEGIIQNHSERDSYKLESKGSNQEIPIYSYREGQECGRHTVKYDSPIDMIEITHDAHSRQGFALGAVLAAEWIIDKKGVYSMRDMLGI